MKEQRVGWGWEWRLNNEEEEQPSSSTNIYILTDSEFLYEGEGKYAVFRIFNKVLFCGKNLFRVNYLDMTQHMTGGDL